MFNFLDDPKSREYKNAVKVARIIFAILMALGLFVSIFFGGDNIKSRESYLKAEVQVRSQVLQQRDLNNDLQKWYVDQQQ